MNAPRTICITPAQQQRGMVLMLSLLTLVALTMLGVSAITTSTLEGRMANNFQLATMVFQAAESEIERAATLADPDADSNPSYDATVDPMITALTAGIGTEIDITPANGTPFNTLENNPITSASTITMVGSGACPGVSFGTLTCYRFEVDSTAQITQANAQAVHTQGIIRAAPGL